jgi:hypothetical protein
LLLPGFRRPEVPPSARRDTGHGWPGGWPSRDFPGCQKLSVSIL